MLLPTERNLGKGTVFRCRGRIARSGNLDKDRASRAMVSYLNSLGARLEPPTGLMEQLPYKKPWGETCLGTQKRKLNGESVKRDGRA